MEKIRELVVRSMNNNYELTEEELEEICGGFAITGALIFVAKAILAGILSIAGGVFAKKWLFKNK